VKAKPSNLKPEVREEQRSVLSLAVEGWVEESFTVPVHVADAAAVDPNLDWDHIEAVGAADDASRFRVDEPLAETLGVGP